jgi:hypothetical protein
MIEFKLELPVTLANGNGFKHIIDRILKMLRAKTTRTVSLSIASGTVPWCSQEQNTLPTH